MLKEFTSGVEKQKGRIIKEVPRILVISDAVAHTGFATVCHSIFEHLYKKYNVHVLGVNYYGDPHQYPYKIYPASTGGDIYGINRLPTLIRGIKPHLIFIINDPWVVKEYVSVIQNTPVGVLANGTSVYPHTVAYMPVDGLNIKKEFVNSLNYLNLAIGYTDFAINELKKVGLTTHYTVIPHGIDLNLFKAIDKEKARKALNNIPNDWYIVGCVNRNQPRKRIDLAMQYFAEWSRDKPENVKFYYHGALRDVGWDIEELAEYYNMQDRLILTSKDINPGTGVTREFMKNIYSSHDVHISTTAGEGWGLTQMESMACAIPNIIPDWSGLGEWAKTGAVAIPCTSTYAHVNSLNTIGGIADRNLYIEELNKMYIDSTYRNSVGDAGYNLVTQPQFQWINIAKKFDNAFTKVLYADNNSS